jgi:glycogen operon protein
MLLMGDEVRRTQHGNNNAYCQDNEISWLQWDPQANDVDLLRFTRALIALRRSHPVLRRNRFLTGKPVDMRGIPDVSWYDSRGAIMDWSKSESGLTCWLANPLAQTSLTATSDEAQDRACEWGDMMLLVNPTKTTLAFSFPKEAQSMTWRLFLDTSKAAPNDVFPEWPAAPKLSGTHSVRVMHRSMMVWIEHR